MRRTFAGLILSVLSVTAFAEDAPLVEQYLHAGNYEEGEKALMLELSLDPENDQLRFGLGVLQFVQGIEHLGQSLHQYGVKSKNTNIPFLRLPVPENRHADEIDYARFRTIMDQFNRDLAQAEVTLAGVKNDKVKLPLHLAPIKLDLDNDGEATDTLLEIMDKIMRQRFEFLKQNPTFRVTFDRGDVPWLRSYCHVLMSMIDAYLAFDLEYWFVESADSLFSNPAERPKRLENVKAPDFIVVIEPVRLSRFRKHLIQVANLNQETWQHIRAEKDDDFEWLPNASQTGIFGMPVRDNMVNGWLAMMGELKMLLEGTRTVPPIISGKEEGLNLKTFLDDPPLRFGDRLFNDLPNKYYSDDKQANINVLFRTLTLFQGPNAMFYAAWFN